MAIRHKNRLELEHMCLDASESIIQFSLEGTLEIAEPKKHVPMTLSEGLPMLVADCRHWVRICIRFSHCPLFRLLRKLCEELELENLVMA